MDRPLVSIITATFNASAFLPAIFHKVRACAYDRTEHIVIDDCSTDGTLDALKALQQEFGFTLIESPVNQGPVRARNQAIAASRGKYILPWDQDNWYSPDYLVTMVDVAERAGERCSPIYSHMILTGECTREMPRPEWSLDRMLEERFVDLGCLFSRRAYDAAGGIDPSAFPISDYELFLNMAVQGFEGRFVDGPRFYYCVRRGSAWDSFRTPEGHARKRDVARYVFGKHRAALRGLGHDADTLGERFIQKYYSTAPAPSLAVLSGLELLADETLKMIPDGARLVAVDKRDTVMATARKNISRFHWIGLAELAALGKGVDCLVISSRLNHPNACLNNLAASVRPGGTLVGRISSAHHWRHLAQTLAGQSGDGYACSLEQLQALLQSAGFPDFEIQAVNAEGAEDAEKCDRFLQASAPLVESLGLDATQFAGRCRASHYVVRAVRPAGPPESGRTNGTVV